MTSKQKSKRPTPDSRHRLAYRQSEVSELTGIPASTLRTMVRRGDLNPIIGFGVWLIAAEELAKPLRVTARIIRNWASTGVIPVALRQGRVLRFSPEAVARALGLRTDQISTDTPRSTAQGAPSTPPPSPPNHIQ